jgi:hypothetical protein
MVCIILILVYKLKLFTYSTVECCFSISMAKMKKKDFFDDLEVFTSPQNISIIRNTSNIFADSPSR